MALIESTRQRPPPAPSTSPHLPSLSLPLPLPSPSINRERWVPPEETLNPPFWSMARASDDLRARRHASDISNQPITDEIYPFDSCQSK